MLPPRTDDPTLTAELRDPGPGSSWVLLLDELAVPRALSLGNVSADVVEHLRRTAGTLEHRPSSLPAAHTVDLLVATPSALRRWTRRRRGPVLQRTLTPEAVVVVTGRHLVARRWRRRLADLLGSPVLATRPGVVMRRRGPLHSPRGPVLTVPSLRPPHAMPRTLRRISTLLRLATARARRRVTAAGPAPSTRWHASDLRPLRPTVRRCAIARTSIASARPAATTTAPPAWLHEVLAAVDVEPSLATWTFVPPRGYRSQKVLFRVTDTSDGRELVVKATQAPRFNARLDAEARALRALEARELVPAGSVPRVLHTTTHGGLRVLVEDACPGVPYRHASTGRMDCPLLTNVTDWVTTLACRSAHTPEPSDDERLGACDALVDDYLAMFTPDGARAALLREHARRVAHASLPLVLYHGDLGLWNLLAHHGSVVVLDWENALPAGPPGWDLWTVLQSHSLFVLEVRGRRPTPANLARLWTVGSPAHQVMTDAVTRYGQVLGVAPSVLVSCGVLAWAHRAVREGARRPTTPHRSWSHRWLDHLLAEGDLLIEPDLR